MSQCHCFIRHAVTKEEREQVRQGLNYARTIGDTDGILLALQQLTGKCPARSK